MCFMLTTVLRSSSQLMTQHVLEHKDMPYVMMNSHLLLALTTLCTVTTMTHFFSLTKAEQVVYWRSHKCI